MRRQELESLLTTRLKLKSPHFKIKKVDNRLCGHVISDSFRGMRDHKRQQLILDALEGELGPDAAREVGMLLAYTNDEWNVDLPARTPKRTKDPNCYPKGWDRKRVEAIIDYYEKQTDDEAIAEAEAAYDSLKTTMMQVPVELVPKIQKLIAKCAG